MVRLRLSRMGRTHRPFYRLNAVEKRTQRNGKVLENLGWYNPMEQDESKQLSLKIERIQHWLSVGATPSDTVGDLLAKNEVISADEWNKMREGRVAKKKAKIVQEKIAEEEARKAEEEAARKAAEEEAAAKAAEEKAAAEAAAAEAAEAPAEEAAE